MRMLRKDLRLPCAYGMEVQDERQQILLHLEMYPGIQEQEG